MTDLLIADSSLSFELNRTRSEKEMYLSEKNL